MYAKYKNKWIGFLLLFMLISLASIFFPTAFGSKITISPLFIFAIIIVCNVWNSSIFQRENKDFGAFFNKIFFINLAVTCLFSFILIVIYKFSIFVGKN